MNATIDEVQQEAAKRGITLPPELLVDLPIGTWVWACHHYEPICEPLVQRLANRLMFILTQKPPREVPVRLAALRRVLHPERIPADCKRAYADYERAYEDWKKAYADYGPQLLAQWTEEYPDHPEWILEKGLVLPDGRD